MKINNTNFPVLIYNRTKKMISLLCKFLKSIKYKIIRKITFCRIEEINLTDKTIIIHCSVIDTPIKLTLDQIIADSIIIANLSSKQASLLGYYYGKYYMELINEKNCHSNINSFSIDESLGKCNIIMLDRHGHLVYSDHSENIHTISPINALKRENLITQFNPIQACYIGILAATHQSKNINKKKFFRLIIGK